MNEQDASSNRKSWRNESRISSGYRKGQFKRKRDRSSETKAAKKRTEKRLCQESCSSVSEKVVILKEASETPSVIDGPSENQFKRKRNDSIGRRGARKKFCQERKEHASSSGNSSEGESSECDVDKKSSCDSLNQDVLGGRELHEPSILAKEMWCVNCDVPLSFRFAQSKVQKGLAFVYDVKCYKFDRIKSVNTSQVFRHNKSDLFAVNAKAAVGIIDAGIGESEFNLLLSAMNVNTVSDTLLKRHERIVGPMIEELAKESCCEVLEEELVLAKEAGDIIQDK